MLFILYIYEKSSLAGDLQNAAAAKNSIFTHTKASLSPVGSKLRNRQVSWLSFIALSAFPTCVSDIIAWAPLTVAGLLRILTGIPFSAPASTGAPVKKIPSIYIRQQFL